MYQTLMSLVGKDNEGSVPRERFEQATASFRTSIGPNLYDRMVELSLDVEDKVNCRLMSRIADLYKYTPSVIKKITNSSEQLQKHTVFFFSKKAKNARVYNNYKLLAKRVEEKFKTMTKAFRYFDVNKVNQI